MSSAKRDAGAKAPQSSGVFSPAVFLPVTLIITVYGFYIRTLYPSVPGGDSGELIAESCNLGVAHPPGYPLFVLVTRAWLDVTAALGVGGSPAWRANLLSAGFDVGAAFLIYKCVVILCRQRDMRCHWPAFAAGAMFALSPLVWLYAVGAEVFSLNNLFVAWLLYATLKYADTKSQGWLVFGAFLCGIALCNQHTAVLYEVPLVLWILWTQRRVITAGLGVKLVLAGLVGLLPYVFLWYSDTYRRQMGSWGDCSTLKGFIRHFLRQDYGTFRLYSRDKEAAGMLERTWLYFVGFFTSEAPFGTAGLAAVGAWACFAKSFVGGPLGSVPNNREVDTSTAGRSIVFALLFYLGVFHTLSNMPLDDELLFGVHARFWQQPNVVAFILLGVGLSVALEWVAAKALGSGVADNRQARRAAARAAEAAGKKKNNNEAPASASASARSSKPRSAEDTAWKHTLLASTVCVGLVAMQTAISFRISDQSENDYMGRYAKAMIDPLPENAVFVSAYDMQWSSGRYMQDCEGLRPDVTLLNNAVLSFDWFAAQAHLYKNVTFPKGQFLAKEGTADYINKNAFSFEEFLDANVGKVPVHHAGAFVGATDVKPKGFEFDPWGVGTRVRRSTDPAPSLENAKLMDAFDAAWRKARSYLPDLPTPQRFDNSTWESTIRMDVLDKQQAYGEFLLDEALAADPIDVPRALTAAALLEECFENRLRDSASMFKNLGLAYARVIQSKNPIPTNIRLPEWDGVRGVNEGKVSMEVWQKGASLRVLDMWQKFLA
eukprot:CAMPEP_0203820576 /NCGR_PEP_ID=MMETSP0115-20131106/40358_1 /ASSEMBLY_ACC=CAM_ASM_000227 /TAXON_ID=33651 /ORGANISM="Bicosoecid sp, Strain ms1" /LENGTH=772 /DNA_ID=CAMNT_0050729589 /DNA_START=252 /DNA_END=2566 /DNA_ORIENTATION=+